MSAATDSNQVFNNHEQAIHIDARVYLDDEDRPRYGGARMIDAETFVTQNPDVKLQEGFTIGTYHYQPASYWQRWYRSEQCQKEMKQ